MAKTIPVKLPVELVEIAKARDSDRPPGEVLLDIVKDYMRLEAYAKSIAGDDFTSASEVIISWHRNAEEELNSIRQQAREYQAMLEGMEIYFRKSGGDRFGKKKEGR